MQSHSDGSVVNSKIQTVTVYRQGALVSRVATVQAGQAGFPDRVKFGGLPLCLDDDSVRVEVLGKKDQTAPLLAREVRVVLEVPEEQSELRPAKPAALLEARRKVRGLEERIRLLGAAIDRLQKVKLPEQPQRARGQAPPRFELTPRLTLSTFRSQRLEGLTSRRQKLQGELGLAKLELRDLQERNEREGTARAPERHEMRKAAQVVLEGGAGVTGSFQIRVDYRVPGARWAPAYVARLDADYGKTLLEMRAVICQRTGEDWEGAELLLSTADPLGWAELPELKSRRIGKWQPEPASLGWRPPPEGIETLFADFDQSAGNGEAPKEIEVTAFLEDSSEELLAGEAACGGAAEPAALRSELGVLDQTAPQARGAASLAVRRKRYAVAKPSAEIAPLPSSKQTHPGDNLLNYGTLRMPPFDASGRGQLRHLKRHEVYLELLQVKAVTLKESVTEAISLALREAELADLRLPRGHRKPASFLNFDHIYRALKPLTIASDGVFHNVEVAVVDISSQLALVAVPREDQNCYRVLRLRNAGKAPLLEGPVDVYLGDRYLLSSMVRNTPAEGCLELGLGIEQAVRVSRNVTFEEQSAIMPSRQQLHHRIEIRIVSHLHHSAALEVRDRIPITQEKDKEIEVKLGRVEPEWKSFRQEESPLKGGYCWKQELAPGATCVFRAEYSLHLANKNEVVGGNRRDS